mgnify:CR=1 FL=1
MPKGMGRFIRGKSPFQGCTWSPSRRRPSAASPAKGRENYNRKQTEKEGLKFSPTEGGVEVMATFEELRQQLSSDGWKKRWGAVCALARWRKSRGGDMTLLPATSIVRRQKPSHRQWKLSLD